ncbi:MAG: hypothetical protein HY673_12705 [Chloroflexi bacterium]|nr:hypothetical protein [Chloroflexota bacterium]
MERARHFKHVLWHGKSWPCYVFFALLGAYDLILAQVFPDSGWPTLSDLVPLWDWRMWLILALSYTVLASLEGSYRMSKSKEVAHTPVGAVATSVITVENYDHEFVTKGDSSYRQDSVVLRLHPEIHATPGVRVEDIELEMKGKRYNTDWEPMKETISGDIGHYVYTKLPKSLKEGPYQARIVAHIENREYYSNDFTLVYRKPSPDMT